MQHIQVNPLLDDDYRPLFSGHETFPLRFGWLKKAYDAVRSDGNRASRDIFLRDEAIADFGVGKNMVASMRHWATCCGIIAADSSGERLQTTALGDLIFGDDGVDPYLESPITLWLLHWQLTTIDSARPTKTTWYWLFNHFPALAFERDDIAEGLLRLAADRNWQRVAPKTVRNDVDCLIRTYEVRQAERESVEDALAAPLSELALIRGFRGHYRLVRGPKRSLPLAVFVCALHYFWQRQSAAKTLSFEAMSHAAGSPGRIFLLDEADMADRLLSLEDATRGAFRWSETAGLRQVLRGKVLTTADLEALLRTAYVTNRIKEAA